MTKCAFCGKDEHSFAGVHFISNVGVVSYYCSSKCRKNAMKLGRDKRKIKWTAAYKEGMNAEKIKLHEKAEKISKVVKN